MIKNITVTQPFLPPLNKFIPYLKDIWKRKWLTNNGFYHQELEKALCEYLNISYISVFSNGTLPLMVALEALDIKGEVITTPYSFVATTHSLWWNGIKPVFVDVEEKTCNLNPDKIENAITSKTTAIMPVHVYGTPCNTEAIKKIANKHGLRIIYDAAHAFGVEENGKSILSFGDITTLSFHATKTYNTAEGGALVCNDAQTKQKIDQLKNFGFASETDVIMPGINGKMDEIRAALGLLNLKYIDNTIVKRQKISQYYQNELKEVSGIKIMDEYPNIKSNYSYFPIFIRKNEYGMSRDELYEKLKQNNIFGRRYFYPLISAFSPYCDLDSSAPQNLPIAHKLADSVLCLPIYADLDLKDVNRICEIIKSNLIRGY